MTRNLILQRLRRDRGHEQLAEESRQCDPIDLTGMERVEMIARAVAALPPPQSETLILAEFEQMSLEEIGCTTGATLAA